MFYDRGDCVADYNANEDLQRYYITPFMDENMVLTDASSGTPSMDFFYAQDGLGTVRQIFDDTSSLVNNYDYEGFGTETSTTGALYNRYRYTGREYDAETEWDVSVGTMNYSFNGTYYYRARTYDTTIGSFTSRDPIPANNLYPYCSANPINYIDKLGETPRGRKGDIDIEFDDCSDCAEKYIQCVINKAHDAIRKACVKLESLLEHAKNGTLNGGILRLFTPEINNLNATYSFFDKDPRTRYPGFTGFDKDNKTHRKELKDVVRRLERMANGLTRHNKYKHPSIRCKKSSETNNLGYGIAFVDLIELNMKLLCKKSAYDDFNNFYVTGLDQKEGNTASTFIHELSHVKALTTDSGWTIPGMGTNIYVDPDAGKSEYPKLDLDERTNHADTFARFVMNYYTVEPKCELDDDCCSTMGEGTD